MLSVEKREGKKKRIKTNTTLYWRTSVFTLLQTVNTPLLFSYCSAYRLVCINVVKYMVWNKKNNDISS